MRYSAFKNLGPAENVQKCRNFGGRFFFERGVQVLNKMGVTQRQRNTSSVPSFQNMFHSNPAVSITFCTVRSLISLVSCINLACIYSAF